MTTVVAVRKDKQICIMGDGQGSLGSVVGKDNVTKVKYLSDKHKNICIGFAGDVAGILILHSFLREYIGTKNIKSLENELIDFYKFWKKDKYLQTVSCDMLICGLGEIYNISGNGVIMKIEENCYSIGSGSCFAYGAAKVLLDNTSLSSLEIATKAMEVAGNKDIHTNHNTKYILV